MTKIYTRSTLGKCAYLLQQRIYDALKTYGLPQSIPPLLQAARQHHGINSLREIAELLTSQVEPDTIPDDKLGLTWTFSYTKAKSSEDLDRYRSILASAEEDQSNHTPHSTIDPLYEYEETEESHNAIGEHIEPEGLGVTPNITLYLHISDPNNWNIQYKIKPKAKQLTNRIQNSGSVDRIGLITSCIARKLLIKRKGYRVNLAAIAKIIALMCPRITYRRCFKVLRVVLEGQGCVIVMRQGSHYLADHVLLPYPVDPSLLDPKP